MAFRNGKSSCLCVPSSTPAAGLDALRYDIVPAGLVDGVNATFTTPDKFVQVIPHVIRVYRNGQRQALHDDYAVSESGGNGTGYDTITFVGAAKIKVGTVIRVDYIAI